MSQSAPTSAVSSPSRSATTSAPDRSSPPARSNAKPRPPAAPAPGRSFALRPTAASDSFAKCSRRASIVGTDFGRTPFCGPKIAVAPRLPQRGLSTSERIVMRVPASRASKALASMRESASRPAGVGSTEWPFASRRASPSAESNPAPPSLVLLPPRPATKRFTPASSRMRINSPRPRVLRLSTGYAVAPGSVSPTTCALSMIAVSFAICP